MSDDERFDETRRDGSIVIHCPARHTSVAPDKGLGRAFIAAWKTRHQECEAKP